MKEMQYSKDSGIKEVLDKGSYKGHDYFILNLGTHPTAYIRLTKESKFYKKDYEEIPLRVHSGLTFADDDFPFNPIIIKDSWWIGWDYAHHEDFIGYYYEDGYKNDDYIGSLKKWTTKGIRKEVRRAIRELIKLEKK